MVHPKHNEVLEMLPEEVFQRLLPHLQLVSMNAGEVLLRPGEAISMVYFPITALICYARDLSDGTCMDTALIGSEGVVGLRGLIGLGVHRVQVDTAGFAYRVPMEILTQEIESGALIKNIFFRFTLQTTRMVSAEGVCSHFHSIEQRLAKWLLMRCDRSQSDRVLATHQRIADSLGVRREAVTHGLRNMAGLVAGQRGAIQVHNRSGLEKMCCECYDYLKNEMNPQMLLPLAW